MTLVVIFMMYGGTLLLSSGIENVSLACTFQWIMNGAQGQPSCSDNPAPTTGTGVGHTQPQTSATPPGSVVYVGNPFSS